MADNGYVAVEGGNGGTGARKSEIAGFTLRNTEGLICQTYTEMSMVSSAASERHLRSKQRVLPLKSLAKYSLLPIQGVDRPAVWISNHQRREVQEKFL